MIFKRIGFICFFLVIINMVYSQVPPPPPAAAPNHQIDDSHSGEQTPTSLRARFIDLQDKGAQYINRLLKELRSGFQWNTFLTVILFSLLYGVFHTLGPGHGKLIVLSYFMEEERTRDDAIVLSLIISLIHASGAILLAILFRTLLSGFKGASRISFQYGFTVFSGILLMILGLYYLVRKIRKGHSHALKEIVLTEEAEQKGLWARNLAAGFSIGIVPCPLSLAIMSISIVSGIFWIGISSVLTLTFSMTLVLYGIAFSTIKTRNATFNSSARNGHEKKSREGLHRLFGYGGSLSMILLGFYICYRGLLSMSVWGG